MIRRAPAILSASVILLALASAAHASSQDVADFYRGKTLSMVIGYPPGGGFDSSARLLLRHMGRHIPGQPTIIAKNMPGAGSLVATNYLYNVAPKDGTEFGMVGGSVAFGPLWSRDGVMFEATKFNWLGSMDRWVGIALIWHNAAITTLDGAQKGEVTVGATGSGDVTTIYPRVMNALIGTKFRIVTGYRGTADLNLAIERGEVAGRLGWCWDCVKAEKPNWVSEGKVKVMVQLAFEKDPDLTDVPLLMDQVKSEADRQIIRLVFGSQEMARPLVAPPGVPTERIEALREAFMATLKDPEFAAEARKLNVPIKVTTARDIQKLIADVYNTPQPVIDRAAKILGGN